MNRMGKFLVITAATLVTALQAEARPPSTYFASLTGPVPLADAGAQQTPVFSIQVPVGTWIVQSKAGIVNFGTADFARCTVLVNGVNVNGGGTMVGQSSGMPALAIVVNQVQVSIATPSTVSLTCFHDSYQAGLYVDSDATFLVARAPGTR